MMMIMMVMVMTKKNMIEMIVMVMVMMMMVTHGETRVGGGSCPPLLAPLPAHRSVAGRPPPNNQWASKDFSQSLLCISLKVLYFSQSLFCTSCWQRRHHSVAGRPLLNNQWASKISLKCFFVYLALRYVYFPIFASQFCWHHHTSQEVMSLMDFPALRFRPILLCKSFRGISWLLPFLCWQKHMPAYHCPTWAKDIKRDKKCWAPA